MRPEFASAEFWCQRSDLSSAEGPRRPAGKTTDRSVRTPRSLRGAGRLSESRGASSSALLSAVLGEEGEKRWDAPELRRPFVGPCYEPALRPGNERLPGFSSISEAVQLRGTMGACVWRGGLDREVAQRDLDAAVLAEHRLACRRAAQRWSRERAAECREARESKDELKARCYRQHGTRARTQHVAINIGAQQALAAQQHAKARAPDDSGGETAIGPLTQQWHQLSAIQVGAAPAPKAPTTEVEAGGGGAEAGQTVSAAFATFAMEVEAENSGPPFNSAPRDWKSSVRARVLKLAEESIIQETKLSSKARGLPQSRARFASDPVSNIEAEGGEGDRAQHPIVSENSSADGLDFEPTPTVRSAGQRRSQVQRAITLFSQQADLDHENIRRVFDLYDGDGNNLLSQSELRSCLSDIGLRGTNALERAEIAKVLHVTESVEVDFHEFETKILPAVRAGLTELQRSQVSELFAEVDGDGSGLLSFHEMTRAVRLLGFFSLKDERLLSTVLEISPDVFDQCRLIEGGLLREKSAVELKVFGAFVALLQERKLRDDSERFRALADEFAINEADQLSWQDSLVELHDAFVRAGISSLAQHEPSSAEFEIMRLLSDHGLVGTDPQQTALVTVQSILSSRTPFDFAVFLDLTAQLREHDRSRLVKVFRRYDTAEKGRLSMLEVQKALKDCRVTPHSRREAEEVRAAIDTFNEGGAAEVMLHDFVRLCQFVAEKLRKQRREEDRRFAVRCGFDEQRFDEFRGAFNALDGDMNGMLDHDEVQQAAHLLTRHTKGAEAEDFLKEVRLMAAEENVNAVQVNFRSFLKLMRRLNDKDEHRRIATELLIDSPALDRLSMLFRKMGPSDDCRVSRAKLRAEAAKIAGEGSERLEQAEKELEGCGLTVGFEIFARCLRRAEGAGGF